MELSSSSPSNLSESSVDCQYMSEAGIFPRVGSHLQSKHFSIIPTTRHTQFLPYCFSNDVRYYYYRVLTHFQGMRGKSSSDMQAFSAVLLAPGGTATTVGSICPELGALLRPSLPASWLSLLGDWTKGM
jgi:hypothetical protein